MDWCEEHEVEIRTLMEKVMGSGGDLRAGREAGYFLQYR